MKLATLEGSTGRDVRRELLGRLLESAEADAAFWYDVDAEGTIVGLEVVGDHAVGGLLSGYSGRRFPAGGVSSTAAIAGMRSWTLQDAPAEVRSRFRTYRQDFRDPDRAEELPLYQQVYRPLGVHDHLRVLAYRGERYLGWFGVVRASRGRFEAREVRRLDPQVAHIVEGLAAARAMDAVGEDAFLILDATGQVERGTEGALRWLSTERAELLARAVRAADRGGEPTLAIDRVHVRLVRLAGQTNVRYLAMLRERDAIELRAASALSMSERAVAEDLAAGLTIREIAASRGRAESTVKSQAKSLYRKLGVASRVELVEALRG